MKDLLLPIIEKHGVTAAIAVALIFWLTVVLQADLTALKNDMASMRREHFVIRYYLEGICLNAADDEAEARRCRPVREE